MSDRDLNHLYPAFAEKVKLVLKDLDEYAAKHMPGRRWVLIEGLRSAAYQNSLYQQGRSTKGRIVTQKDGYKSPSNHQSGLAVDIVPFKGKTPDFEGKPEWWAYLGHCARKHGLKFGGDWKKFKDIDHVEWPTEDKATYKAAKAWLKKQGLG